MIKFMASHPEGHKIFGFGFSETNIKRLKFNREPIFFDFADLETPGYFGLVVYQEEFNMDELQAWARRVLNPKRGVTADTLRAFVLTEHALSQMQKGMGFPLNVEIESPNDIEIFFSGKSEREMEELLKNFFSPKTKRTTKGFGEAIA